MTTALNDEDRACKLAEIARDYPGWTHGTGRSAVSCTPAGHGHRRH